ncbi:gluconate 2-dehydrogenase subunit 3 family protein [Mucilaginibacter arboris]|uniref:Gluconate 2-dehydrogenase subunit 3 family protein n=1 Tax=Mucilaginibacter arboris TaxID=2682090 RepID=A0A7K1SYI6_9SPHI|nr:gluconate 2-dehydrogenase subunit 3 family protein [Mucilaginibacter arboris]MVN22363.1 gluconate 2-dehydrogenase subunit 3 family protein [Mucilaginibacter arboris]
MMNRRSAIKNMTILASGVFLFPSCLKHEDGKVSIKLNKMHINAAQEKLVANVAETIIPQTDSPGAKALNVHQFVLKMMDDCHNKKDQDNFIKGLAQLEDFTKARYKHSFAECTPKQREDVLLSIEQNKQTEPALTAFYQMQKQLTVQGYGMSKYVMTTKLPYELVPGRYNGYFPVKNLKNHAKNG